MPIIHTKAGKKIVPVDKLVQYQQVLRLKRFCMALSTYIVVFLSVFIVTKLGLGDMNAAQWAAFIGIGILFNTFFFVYIHLIILF